MPDYITRKIPLPIQTSDEETTNSSDQIIYADPVVLINSEGEFFNSISDASAANQEEIISRLPSTLINDRLKVDVQSLNVTVQNAQLEISNDTGNPVPVSGNVNATLTTIGDIATNTTLTNLVNKIPTSPSLEHTTANSPSSVRLTDGTNFYKPTTPSDIQSISGNVTANIGATNGLALDTTLTNGNQKVKLTDGTNSPSISNTTLTGNEYALVTRTIPSGIQTVNGTVTFSNTSIGINSLPSLPTGTNSIGSITVSNFPSTQTVAGTVNLDSTNTGYLNSINTKLPSKGLTTASNSTPVVLASDQATIPVSIQNSSLEISNDIGNPVPVVIASNQSSIPVAFSNTSIGVSSLPSIPTGTNIIGGVTQSGTWNVGITGTPSVSISNANPDPSTGTGQATTNTKLTSLDTKLPTQGQALISTSLPVVLPASQITTLTPPTTVGISGNLPSFATTPTIKLDQTTPGTTNKVSIGSDGIVSNISNKFRDDFDGNTLKSNIWQVLQTGTGQSVTVTNSELQIVGGTTANSSTIIRSLVGFTMPMEVNWIFYLSQTIINREIYFELIDSTGNNVARAYFNSSSNNSYNTQTVNNGNSLAATPYASGVPFIAYTTLRCNVNIDQIDFYFLSPDNPTIYSTGATTKTRFIPDPSQIYYLQIRFNNLATAPVSSTTLYLDTITVKSINEVSVQVINGRGAFNTAQALPVNIVNSNTTVQVSTSSIISTTDSFGSTYTESLTPLGVTGTYTGIARASGNIRNYIRGWVYTDQAGTLILQQSTDATTWRQTLSVSVSGGTPATLFEQKLYAFYYRILYTNGSTAQTVLQIISTMFNG